MTTDKPTERTFGHALAMRGQIPLWLGLIGPSNGGKTKSALRLATGIQRIVGGDIWVVDTEKKRALHYADDHMFQHVPFDPPFNSLDYLAAANHCVNNGAKIVVFDSFSHEHDGPGGHLLTHALETERLAAKWRTSYDKAAMSAWAVVKTQRRAMINGLLQLDCSFIFCFRGKDKIKLERGKDPDSMGMMAVGAYELVFEMCANMLLHPGAKGIPTTVSDEEGERLMIKCGPFEPILLNRKTPLDEATGEQMARWARGDGAAKPETAEALLALTTELSQAPDKKTLRALISAAQKRRWTGQQRTVIATAKDDRLLVLGETPET